MPNDLFQNLSDARSEIETMLGGSSVAVELNPTDLNKCLKDALREYNHNRPLRLWRSVDVTSAKDKYDVTENGIMGLLRVDFVQSDLGLQKYYEDPFYLDAFSTKSNTVGGAFNTVGDYHQSLSYRENAREIMSAENEWTQQWEGDKLYLYVSAPFSPRYVAYQAAFGYAFDETDTTRGIQLLPQDDAQWVIDYATAKAKQILARVRGKFQGVVDPNGSMQQLDSQQLQREAKEEMKELKQQIKRRQRPLPPIIG